MEQKDLDEPIFSTMEDSKPNKDNSWQTLYDEETQRYYSFNCCTGESFWLDNTTGEPIQHDNAKDEAGEKETKRCEDQVDADGNPCETIIHPSPEHCYADQNRTFEKLQRLHESRMERFWKVNKQHKIPHICGAFGALSLVEDQHISVTSSEKQAYKVEFNLPSGVTYPEAKSNLPPLASTLLLGAAKIYDSNDKHTDGMQDVGEGESGDEEPSNDERKRRLKKTKVERKTQKKRQGQHRFVDKQRLRRVPDVSVADASPHEPPEKMENNLQELSDAALELFNMFDVSGDGFVPLKDVTQALLSNEAVSKFVIQSKVLRPLAKKPVASQLVNELRHERDDSGQVSSDAFHSLVHRLLKPKTLRLRQTEFKKLFDLIDRNGDGSLDINELRRALRNNPNVIQLLKRSKFLQPFLRFSTVKKLDDLFRKYDVDNSCSLSWREFLNLCIMLQ